MGYADGTGEHICAIANEHGKIAGALALKTMTVGGILLENEGMEVPGSQSQVLARSPTFSKRSLLPPPACSQSRLQLNQNNGNLSSSNPLNARSSPSPMIIHDSRFPCYEPNTSASRSPSSFPSTLLEIDAGAPRSPSNLMPTLVQRQNPASTRVSWPAMPSEVDGDCCSAVLPELADLLPPAMARSCQNSPTAATRAGQGGSTPSFTRPRWFEGNGGSDWSLGQNASGCKSGMRLKRN